MQRNLFQWRLLPVLIVAALTIVFMGVPTSTFAATGTTATIQGTVIDAQTGAPIAGVKVNAVSPSQTSTATTDSHGFYVFNGLTPDTYTLSFQVEGFSPVSEPGITASQNQTVTYNSTLSKALRTIARTVSRSASNLVQPNNGTDVYNISAEQAAAATGANNNSQTLNTYLGTVPGVTISGGVGFPRIRGSDTHDVGYEFDGIPIRERIFGLFTTNITDVGIGSTEVYTGGLPANSAGGGAGVINTVAKTGTYPHFGNVTAGMFTPDYNHYLTVEYGGQTENRRFSYYGAYGFVSSKNVYGYGLHSYPNDIGFFSGPVAEHDIVGNLHYRPNEKDDFQFLIQNGLGDFNLDYGLPTAGQPGALSLTPCPGYSKTAAGASSSYFGVVGGTAPNGQTCPLGFFWGAIPGPADILHHYSGIGKVQWNHNINDHSFFDLRLAENFNQYIFDEPYADANRADLENPGGYLNVSPSCPVYPYTPGTPVQGYVNGPYGPAAADNLCGHDQGSFSGDRKSHMYFLSGDYTNSVSPNLTFRAGAGQEYDVNLLSYYLRDSFNANGTYPNNYTYSDVPTHVPDAYASADIRLHKLLLTPGIFWSRIWYGAPALLGGSRSAGIWNPTFNGTYSFSPRDALRFSYGNSSSFIGEGFLYRTRPFGSMGVPVVNPSYDPNTDGASINAELVQSGDLMLEHDFGDNTSMRIGPYYNNSVGYYESYSPIKSVSKNGAITLGPATNSNSGRHHELGAEFALNHLDRRSQGLSFWLTGTYDNFWSTSGEDLTSSGAIFAPLPSYFTSRGILDRNPSNPLFTASLTADYHSGRFHWYPEVFYNVDTFYNVGYSQPTDAKFNPIGPPVLLKNNLAGAWYLVNMTWTEDLGPNKDFTIGITARNIIDQGNGPTPCQVQFSGDTSTGCFNGPFSGIHNTTPGEYIYQPIANLQNNAGPQTFELFLNKKL